MSDRVAIYTDGGTRPRFLGRLLDAQVDLDWHTTGSRRYLAGSVTTYDADTLHSLFKSFPTRPAWVAYGETFIRIQLAALDFGRATIYCDQSVLAIAHTAENGSVVPLRVVEPSPPCPTAKWVEDERARAIRDYEAERQR